MNGLIGSLPGLRVRTRRIGALGGLIASALLVLPAPTWAHGGAPVTFTEVVKDRTVTFADVNPCTGDAGFNTITHNAVVHRTSFPDGHWTFTSTQTGTAEFDTTDPARPDYTGRATLRVGDNVNQNVQNGTFTLRVNATGTDGSTLRFHLMFHYTIVGTDVVVQFDKLTCGLRAEEEGN